MKRTTYILLITLAAGAVFSLLSPVLLFKASKMATVNVARAGRQQSVTVQPFSTLEVRNDAVFSLEEVSEGLSFSIVEADDVKQPTISCDASWKGNFSLDTDGDDTLVITLDMDKAEKQAERDKKGAEPYIVVGKGNASFATVTVPRGMLSRVDAGGNALVLKNFRGGDMKVANAYNGFRTLNSFFSSLSIVDDLMEDYEF